MSSPAASPSTTTSSPPNNRTSTKPLRRFPRVSDFSYVPGIFVHFPVMRRGGRLCPPKGSYEFAADFRISVVQFAGRKAASAPTVLWTSPRVYLKTPNAPGQRVFLRCAASFFLEIRQYSCKKMSCATQKFLAAGHIVSFQIHPRKFVGVDAHIDPAVKTVFTKIQCEFDGAPRGDVGIAPYAFLGKSNKHKNPDAVRCIGIFFQDRGISIYASRLSTGIGFSCRSRGSGSIRTD